MRLLQRIRAGAETSVAFRSAKVAYLGMTKCTQAPRGDAISRRIVLTALLTGLCAVACALPPAAAQRRSSAPAADSDRVVATVGDESISRGDVARLVAKIALGEEVPAQVLPRVQAQALSELVNRRLVLAYARRNGAMPKAAEIDAEIAGLKTKLTAQGTSLDHLLKTQGVDLSDLKRQVAWNLVWHKYQARYLTEERLTAYFQSHRRDFDGTEVSARHILLKLPKGGGPQAADDLATRAAAIRDEIASGRIAFADAARKHSAGPSAQDGGLLGFLPRHGVMDEAFSRAAFALEPGQVSQPVRTPFGVHLIQCEEVKPGRKQLAEVRQELEEALARELLVKLADVEAKHTPVRFTGAGPYFKPGTRELAAP